MAAIRDNDPIRQFEPLWGVWRAISVLGEGSYGRVYEVERTDDLKFRSAVKLITIPKNDAECREARQMGMDDVSIRNYFGEAAKRIMNEIDIMYSLKGQPHVVAYEDHMVIHEENTLTWNILIRMELLIPLSDYIADNPLEAGEVKRLGIEICTALAACAEKNIIHRDVKENNVFLHSRGAFKLGDFGIARGMDGAMSMSMKGTPAYIAPEIYSGRSYDASVDIYSLGVLMYKLLNAGRYPFLPPAPQPITVEDTELAFARRIQGEPVPRPLYGDLQLQNVVLKACAFDPKDRFASAQEMIDALRMEASAYVQVPPPPVPVAGGKSANNTPRKGMMIAVGAAAFVLAVLLGRSLGAPADERARYDTPIDPSSISEASEIGYLYNANSNLQREENVPLTDTAETLLQEEGKTDVAVWNDAQFEALIRQLLDRPTGDILCSELEDIKKLNILGEYCTYDWYDYSETGSARGDYLYKGKYHTRSTLTNISDLDKFKNLEELSISCTSIRDLTGLENLSKLKTLRLTSNYLRDISAMENLTELTELRVWRNQISDLSPLEGLHKLRNLTISSNQIDNLWPLQNLTNLESLNAYNNQITDIWALNRMSKLRDLNLADNRIKDVIPLGKLASLRQLNLHNNNITEVGALQTLSNLQTLTLQGNEINSYAPVAHVPNLTPKAAPAVHTGSNENSAPAKEAGQNSSSSSSGSSSSSSSSSTQSGYPKVGQVQRAGAEIYSSSTTTKVAGYIYNGHVKLLGESNGRYRFKLSNGETRYIKKADVYIVESSSGSSQSSSASSSSSSSSKGKIVNGNMYHLPTGTTVYSKASTSSLSGRIEPGDKCVVTGSTGNFYKLRVNGNETCYVLKSVLESYN